MLEPFYQDVLIEAGCDEAGRGCLAGPVVAAAVILPKDFFHPLLNDSKQLSEANRNLLEPIIKENAIEWKIGICDNHEIDKINILKASFKAMHRALDQFTLRPEHLIIDGNRFNKYKKIPHTCIIQGDGKYMSIAAASILAKTYRDKVMSDLHDQVPHYNLKQNKGYPTKEHRRSIMDFGDTNYHRKTFRLLAEPELF